MTESFLGRVLMELLNLFIIGETNLSIKRCQNGTFPLRSKQDYPHKKRLLQDQSELCQSNVELEQRGIFS